MKNLGNKYKNVNRQSLIKILNWHIKNKLLSSTKIKKKFGGKREGEKTAEDPKHSERQQGLGDSQRANFT